MVDENHSPESSGGQVLEEPFWDADAKLPTITVEIVAFLLFFILAFDDI